MADSQRIAIVTGANKGIGFAIVRQLALRYPSSPLSSGSPLLIYLTARNDERGQAAVSELQSDPEIKSSGAQITYHTLDISQSESITAFAHYIGQQHPEGVDVVINNAGIAMNGFDDEVVRKTLECNYYGTLTATEAFIPLLRPSSSSRLVNVASMVGGLNKYSPELQNKFRAAQSPSDVSDLMSNFQSSVADGSHTDKGWPSAAYAVSKAGLIGVTKSIAGQEKMNGSHVLINSCCPGYVKTDLTRGGGFKTPDQGAQTPVMLGLDDLKGVSGAFWQDGKQSEW